MRSKNFFAFLISLLFLAGHPGLSGHLGLSGLWAAEFKHPDFEPAFSLSEVFAEGQAPASYSADEVFKMGLLFSECQPGSESWKLCLGEFEKIKRAVKSAEMQDLTEAERGREILKYLYRNYLKSYSLNQTKLDTALESGSYNCVSSAVLYLAAAKAAGLWDAEKGMPSNMAEIVAHSSEMPGGFLPLRACSGWTDIFIYPGYRFRVVDGLITNFHLPQSTLIMLVSAFYDREHVLEAYRTAVEERYRFFSFGDAMLLL